MRFLVATGLGGSGKTIFTDIAKELGFFVISFGDVVREEVQQHGLPLTTENDRKMANWFNANDDNMKLLVEKAIRKIPHGVSTIVIDGHVTVTEVRHLKRFGDVKIVAITAPEDVRFRRLLKRGRIDTDELNEIIEKERREIGYGVLTVMNQADYRLDNSGALIEFRERALEILRDYEGEE